MKKIPTYQLSLWDDQEPQPVLMHQHMELHFTGGEQKIVCAGDTKPRQYRKDNIYAGYIGFPVPPEECSICNPKEALSCQ